MEPNETTQKEAEEFAKVQTAVLANKAAIEGDKESNCDDIYSILRDSDSYFVSNLLKTLKDKKKEIVIEEAEPAEDEQTKWKIGEVEARCFEQIVDWMKQRTFTEKLTAILLHRLIQHEHVFNNESVGNQLSREYIKEVLEGNSDEDMGYLRGSCLMMGIFQS